MESSTLSPKEILKRVRRIEIRTSRYVNDVFAGEYSSVFKGRGMDFAEVRLYQPGDEVSTIDWNVTARMRKPYVKRFQEERELTVMLVVDVSGSVDFGTYRQFKRELMTEVCAVLALAAVKNNDKVGLLMFTDQVEKFIPPRKGRKHVLRVIREVLESPPLGRRTNIANGLNYLNRVTRRHSVVFLISDFHDSGYETAVRLTARRHDLIALVVKDRREWELPPIGFIELWDAETGEWDVVDTRSSAVRHAIQRAAQEQEEHRRKLFRSLRMDCAELTTGQSYLEPLLKLFRERERRLR